MKRSGESWQAGEPKIPVDFPESRSVKIGIEICTLVLFSITAQIIAPDAVCEGRGRQ